MRPDLIDALDIVRDELSRIDEDESASARIVIVTCMRALRDYRNAEGLTPAKRAQARSAYRMACAHMGVEHE